MRKLLRLRRDEEEEEEEEPQESYEEEALDEYEELFAVDLSKVLDMLGKDVDVSELIKKIHPALIPIDSHKIDYFKIDGNKLEYYKSNADLLMDIIAMTNELTDNDHLFLESFKQHTFMKMDTSVGGWGRLTALGIYNIFNKLLRRRE